MQKKKRNKISSSSGFTLVELIIVLIIAASLGGVVYGQLNSTRKTTAQFGIDSDREILKTKCSIYYLTKAQHAVNPDDITGNQTRELAKFTNWLEEVLQGEPLKDEEGNDIPITNDLLPHIKENFKWINTTELLEENLIDSRPKDDRYILDTSSYTVYHVTDGKDVIASIYANSGSQIPNLENLGKRRIPIPGMEKINDVVEIGGRIIVGGDGLGGEGNCILAIIDSDKIVIGEDGVGKHEEVTNISDKLSDAISVTGVSPALGGISVEYVNAENKVEYAVVEL